MFRDREDAARQLAKRLTLRSLERPVVLAIPRGGVPIGAILADALHAELDVLLVRKLRAPFQPELALGAISETGDVYLNPELSGVEGIPDDYWQREQRFQLSEIARRKDLFRRVRPAAKLAGRSVIVTDDGIATGATLIAALGLLRNQSPHEIIVAVPVAPRDRLDKIRAHCDELVCLSAPTEFHAIGQFYEDFSPVEDDEVVALLKSAQGQTADK
jgi:predicted phosphoribosyltransferase